MEQITHPNSTQTQNDTWLVLKNIHIAHRDKVLLDIEHLQLPKNKLIAFIGPNGAGKSTLLHSILDQHTGSLTTQGNISANGEPIQTLVKQGKIGWVGQHERFELPLTVLDYALLGTSPMLAWYQRPKANHVQQAQQLLHDFELTHLTTSRIQTLSGGEKQRLAVVRALMQNTNILMFDEPCNHLDIRHQRFLLNYLHQLVHQQNKSIIVVLHDLTQAHRYTDEVVLLNQGKVVAQGAPETIMTSSQLSTVYHVDIKVHQTEDGVVFV
ncbi:ABC transporter ATP-binding protein [Psychrobacter sp. I-STPA6b]|uniref:ABC transporter ATP-binding protein n=1 Tax=Psychrobacter sp. I-STPA6b TaxID=2585718 RepID=UPI001D0C4156|nr:ABC transporter ATP-binding protein [Psychrobacter sp. I-STPA6b]